MRAIAKSAEPRSLTTYRQEQPCDYEDYRDKGALRHTLVTEQRGLCCYCMGRIQNEHGKMKIEHWKSQSLCPEEQLNYQNLLGACLGGEGRPQRFHHCDTKKGCLDLCFNPADPGHHVETRLRYEVDGSIRSDEPEFDAQLAEVLNLNLPILKNNRKGILDGILDWLRLEKESRRGPVLRARFERERDRRIAATGPLEPYCQVAVYWLEQRIRSM